MSDQIIDITPEPVVKPKKKRKKVKKRLTKTDIEVLKRKQADPLKPLLTIGKELVEEGLSRNPKSVYTNWSKLDYKQREITEVREHHEQVLLRDLMPIAHKVVKKRLKDNDLRAAKTVYDKAYGERDIRMPAPHIRIDQIQMLSIHQSNERQKELDND